MNTMSIIIFALAVIAFSANRRLDRTASACGHFTGWQKVFGIVAVIGAILILINPDFVALGLLGDTAYFDLLVLGLSLQLHVFAAGAWRWLGTAIGRVARLVRIPSPGFSYLLFVSALAVWSVMSAVQKALHRICS